MERNDLTVELTTGQIINRAMKIYKENFLYFLNISIVFILPVLLITIFSIDMIISYTKELTHFDISKVNTGFFKTLTYLLGISAVNGMIFFFYKCSLIDGAGFLVHDVKSSLFETIVAPLKLFFPVLLTSILSLLMIFFGCVLFIVPGFILGVLLIFVPQVMMVEKKFFFHAFDRSFFIIKKHFWKTFNLVIVFYAIYYFISVIFSSALSLADGIYNLTSAAKTGESGVTESILLNKWVQLGSEVINYLIFILIMPVLHIAVTLKFHNLKYMKEGTGILNDINKELEDNETNHNDNN